MVRTRFAPSPTGYMHIGNLRTALYAYLFAKHSEGAFVLRIEDTDRKRHVPAAIQVIYNSLKLAGMEYDEGPDRDGGYGPYVQSQRKPIYLQYADVLIEKGGAFRCFCQKPETRPVGSRKKEFRDPCRWISAEESLTRMEDGEAYVVRQRIPDEGKTSFDDHVFGRITVDNSGLDDQILIKSDGMPTYNFANVIDDHLMEITHVIRGMEYLSSTPKYNLLYRSFGWDIPEYAHLPHISKASGKKLSKREGDASFQDLIDKGYLPQAIVNYIVLLGWNPGDEREYFPLEELVKVFSIDRIGRSKAMFSIQKLEWLNGVHIRKMDVEEFHKVVSPFYSDAVKTRFDTLKISSIIQPRIEKLSDTQAFIDFLLAPKLYLPELFVSEKAKVTLAGSLETLERIPSILESLIGWTNETLYESISGYAKANGFKTGAVMWPIRIALSGQETTPGGATELAEILGKEETLKRLAAAAAYLKKAPDQKFEQRQE
ncbi:MAG: glutamate--tRNA ligase [Anaerolineaceae bacterium]